MFHLGFLPALSFDTPKLQLIWSMLDNQHRLKGTTDLRRQWAIFEAILEHRENCFPVRRIS